MRLLKLILEMLFWCVAALLAMGAAAVVVGVMTTPALSYLGGAGVLVLLPLVLHAARALRRRRAAAILAYLEQAVRLNLPLPRLIDAAQRGERGAVAYRLLQLRHRLEDGYPIAAALRTSVPEIPPRDIALLAAAERVGQVRHALQRILRQFRATARAQASGSAGGSSGGAFSRAYPFLMSVVILSVVGMIGVFVMPKFESIFRDFNVQMPRVTVLTFSIARDYGPLMLVATVLAVVLWAGAAMWQAFNPAAMTWGPLRGPIDRLLWSLPLSHRWARDRGLAEGLDLVAEALRAGTAVDRALIEASCLHVNHVLRDRFAHWAERVQAGTPLHDGARAAWMPGLVVGMLATTQSRNAADGADTLAFLARYYGARFSRTALLLRSAAGPLMVVAFGFLVAWVALSLFLPMMSLIETTSAKNGGL